MGEEMSGTRSAVYDVVSRTRRTAGVVPSVERAVATASPRPSDPEVARAFATIDPAALPTSQGGVVDGRDPEAVPNTCQDVTTQLCKVLERLGINACEVYLSVDHRLRRVDVSRAVEAWQWEARTEGIWGHVVLGVPARRGEHPLQLEGPHGAVELWDWTGRQFDAAVDVPHLVDLGEWGPYEGARRPTCRRCAHRVDDSGLDRCLLPDQRLRRYLASA